MSVIVPAYNEAGRIGDSLRRIRAHLAEAGYEFEVMVVDDGSRDRTVEIVGEAVREDARVKLVRHDTNVGKGGAVRTGAGSARGDVILFSDADLSTPIEEIDRLLPWLDSHDVVIASRSLPDSNVVVHQPFYRELMGRIYNVFVQALVVRGIIDTQCGFKLMSRRAADGIFALQRINSFSFDVEIILIAKRLGFRIKEVPVRWINSRSSKVHPVADSLEMLLDLFRIKIYDTLGFYKKPY